MAKNPFERYIPSAQQLRENPLFARFGETLFQRNLWRPARETCRKATFLGLFWAAWPIPFQMVIVAAMAIRLKANIPLGVSLVWVTNPVTIAPLTLAEYKVGVVILGMRDIMDAAEMEQAGLIGIFSLLFDKIADLALPVFVGSFVIGILAGAAGYLVTDLIWRFYAWRSKNGLKDRA